jgi:small subunit ribosomal protein S20
MNQEISMANHASALKAHRQSVTRKNRNRSNRSELRTGLKQFSELLEKQGSETARDALTELYSLVDKASRKKAISKNAAARQKSRFTKRWNAAAAATSKE